MSIEENIADSKAAADLLSLAEPEFGLRFWEVIRDTATERAPLPKETKTIQRMNEKELREFEKEIMPFGIHFGLSIGEIYENEPQYLRWLVSKSEKFQLDLIRYMRTMDFKE